jgi:cytochrome c oxidase cbb3-type subunit 3
MTTNQPNSSRAGRVWLCLLVLVIAMAPTLFVWLPRRAEAARLVMSDPALVLKDPALVSLAQRLARPLYRDHCASCHGAQRQGDPSRGVPSLADAYWLYGDNPVDVEAIVLYGIRSGHPRARNLTDMPAMGRTGQLDAEEIEDVVNYVLQISHQSADSARAERGRVLFQGKGNCFDCHANDARGVTDYGTPALTGPTWLYGGDHDSLYRSVYDGRHGICPFRTRTLTALQARALTISLLGGATHGSHP